MHTGDGILSRAYICSGVTDELSIVSLRDTLYQQIGFNGEYYRKRPHITLVPPFSVKDGKEKDLKKAVRQVRLAGKEVKTERVGVYENIHNPHTILLRVQVDIEEEEKQIREHAKRYSNSKVRERASPHITLLKSRINEQDLDRQKKRRLQEEIKNRVALRDTELTKPNVVIRD